MPKPSWPITELDLMRQFRPILTWGPMARPAANLGAISDDDIRADSGEVSYCHILSNIGGGMDRGVRRDACFRLAGRLR